MSDPNKKSTRTFQCRDVLWETFELMARELECSIDYLINEAMKQYARQRSYGTRTPFPGRAEPAAPAAVGAPARGGPPPLPGAPAGGAVPFAPPAAHLPPPPPAAHAAPPPAPRRASLPPPPPPRVARAQQPAPMAPPTAAVAPQHAAGRLPPPPPKRAGAPPSFPGPGSPAGVAPPASRGLQQPGPAPLPPPVATAARQPAQQVGHAPYGVQLTIWYQNQPFVVGKDRFIIGRGKQSSDLTIKDPNVSRQHAMVEYLNGQYYMVDMGSTNGIEYNGQRIARKAVAEGDIFRICDHELRFTFR